MSSDELWELDGSFHSQGGAGWRATLADHREDVVREQRWFHCLFPKVWQCWGEWYRQDWSSLWPYPLGGSLFATLFFICFCLVLV